MLNNSERFIKAHKTAKQIRDCFSSYRGAFAFALTEIYAMERQERTAIEQTTAEKLEALGISVWESKSFSVWFADDLRRDYGWLALAMRGESLPPPQCPISCPISCIYKFATVLDLHE